MICASIQLHTQRTRQGCLDRRPTLLLFIHTCKHPLPTSKYASTIVSSARICLSKISMAIPSARVWRHLHSATRTFFHLNFYRVHLLYFILVIFVASGILYSSSTSNFRLRYIDAIFLSTSAMCSVGLATVNLGSLTGFQLSILFVLMIMGDLTVVTISVVVIRRYYFSNEIRVLLKRSAAGRQIAEDI